VWPVPLAQVLPRPETQFSFQNLAFWNLFEFSVGEITLKSISPFSEEIIQYSRTFAPQVQLSWNQAHASQASQFGGFDPQKQNKQIPS
jgi:hypothetical protein